MDEKRRETAGPDSWSDRRTCFVPWATGLADTFAADADRVLETGAHLSRHLLVMDGTMLRGKDMASPYGLLPSNLAYLLVLVNPLIEALSYLEPDIDRMVLERSLLNDSENEQPLMDG